MDIKLDIREQWQGASRFLREKQPMLLLRIACGFLIYYIAASNLRHWLLIHEKTFSSVWLSRIAGGQNWAFFLFFLLLPIGLGVGKRHWRLSEWWLVLLATSLLIGLSWAFGFQNPYVDNVYYDRPWERFGEAWGVCFTAMVFLQGIPLTGIYFWRRRCGVKINRRPVWWRIASTSLAWSLSIALIVIAFTFGNHT